MKRTCLYGLLPVLILNAAAPPIPSKRAVPQPAVISARGQAPAAPRRLVYHPPQVGMPKVTAACGMRGEGVDRLELTVLAPAHVGWTSLAAPVLLWHRAGLAAWPLEATLVVPGRAEPVLQVRLQADGDWHRLDLARHQIELEPDLTYRWAVSAIIDPAQRSKDLVAEGAIQRVTVSEDVAAGLARGSDRERVLAAARHGLWYDAVSALAGELEQHPEDHELWEWRVSLCEQAGLKELALRARNHTQAGHPSDIGGDAVSP